MRMSPDQWRAASNAAYRHPSGLFCFKGSLDGYPGYTDEEHPRHMAAVAYDITRRIQGEAWQTNPNVAVLLRSAYRAYLDHCIDARMEASRTLVLDLVYYEPLRVLYQQATGKVVLPLVPYYDGDVGELEQVLPQDAWFALGRLYADYSQYQRTQRMVEQQPDFKRWLPSCRIFNEYPDLRHELAKEQP